MAQQGSGTAGPQPQPRPSGAAPSLDWAREHLEARWEARQLADQAAAQPSCALALLGDSITAQLAAHPLLAGSMFAARASRPHPLIEQTERELGGSVGVFGVPGDTVENLAWRLAHGGMPAARAFVVQIGTNDVYCGDSPERIAEKITELARFLRARNPHAHVVLLGLFWMDFRPKHAQAINAALRAFAVEAGDPLLHYCTAGDSLPPELFPDGIHPEDEAWERVFQTLIPMVKQLLQPAAGG